MSNTILPLLPVGIVTVGTVPHTTPDTVPGNVSGTVLATVRGTMCGTSLVFGNALSVLTVFYSGAFFLASGETAA